MAGKKRARYLTKKEIAAARLNRQGGRPTQMRGLSMCAPDEAAGAIGSLGFSAVAAVVLAPEYVVVRRDELAILEQHYSAAPVSELVENAEGLLGWLDWLEGPEGSGHSEDTRKWMQSLRAALAPHIAARNKREGLANE